MSGDEESRARAVLAEMQLRISQGPYSALGVTDRDPADQVRAAFLSLTKQFHPARFGRMSPELQRLSNEVFLGIKSAHDQLVKALGGSLRPMGSARTAGMPVVNAEGTMRTSAPRGTASIPRPVSAGTSPPPTQFARGTDRSTGPTARPSAPAIGGHAGTPATGVPLRPSSSDIPTQRGVAPGSTGAPRTGTPQPTGPLPRPPTPSAGTAPLPRTQPSSSGSTTSIPRVTASTSETEPLQRVQPSASASQAMPRATTAATSASQAMPRQGAPSASASQAMPRQGAPSASASQAMPRQGAASASASQSIPRASDSQQTERGPSMSGASSQNIPRITTQSQPLQRPTTAQSQPLQRPGTPGAAQRPSSPVLPPRAPADGFNPGTVRGVPAAPGGAFDEQTAYQDAVALLEAKNWTAARLALHALAAKVPQSKPYRALLCYARGREAHIAGRVDDALLEYQRALQLDPDLAVVKNAVADLQRRR